MGRTFCIVLCALSGLFAAFWCFLRYKSFLMYYDLINAADKKAFPLPTLLGPGFYVLVKMPGPASYFSSLLARRFNLSDFDCYCALAWAVSLFCAAFSVFAALSALIGNVILSLCGFALSLLAALFPLYLLLDRKKSEKEEIDATLPQVISKLALLSETGLPLTEAWHRTARSGEGIVYEAMKLSSEMMKNGLPLTDAMRVFAESCGTKTARQLSAVVVGKISRGGEGLGSSLRYLHSESWDARRVSAKLRGQSAASALVFPLILMFIGIIIMIAVPLLNGISF